MIITYSHAQKLFDSARDPTKGKPLENNTRLVKTSEGFAIKYHGTNIVDIKPDGYFILRTGGWKTYTTKDRLNKYSPLTIWQKNRLWYVSDHENKIFLFEEDLICDALGVIYSDLESEEEINKLNKAKNKLDKLIKVYINGFIEDIKENGLGKPDLGDCWGCMFTTQKSETKHPLDEPFGLDHYFSHFKEKYYVRSLLWKAINERGYRNPSFIWYTISNSPSYTKEILKYWFGKRKFELAKLFIEMGC